MAEDKVAYENGHCPDCGSTRAETKKSIEEVYNSFDFDSVTTFSIMECRGCGEHYFKRLHTNSEDYDYWEDPETKKEFSQPTEYTQYWPPPSKRTKPDWLDDLAFKDYDLFRLLGDVYTALDSNLDVLAAIGMRTVFDRSAELLNIDPKLPFVRKVEELEEKGEITAKEKPVISVLIDAGSAAAHRGWRPKHSELSAMASILESFIHRAFIIDSVGADLKKKVPPKI